MGSRELQWAGIAVIRPPEPLTSPAQPDQPPAGRRNAAIQAVFLQTPNDLKTIAEWLLAIDIKTVAMEPTGIYWISTLRNTRVAWNRSLSC
jgi:hypothetical protein